MRWPKRVDIAFVIAYRTQISQIKKHRFTQITAGWKTDCPSPISKHGAMRVDFWLIEWTSISYVGCWCWYGSEWIGMECWGTKHGMEMTKRTYRHGSTFQIINICFSFFCTTAGWWGKSVVFGQRSRLAGGSCAAILHNVSLYAFFSLILKNN